MKVLSISCLMTLFLVISLQISSFAQEQNQYTDHYCNKAHSARNHFNPMLRTNPLTEGYDLKYYRFEWDIDPAINGIAGTVTPYFKVLGDDFAEINFDFSSAMTIDSIVYHGQKLAFSQPSSYLLKITLPAAISVGTLDSLSITYQGAPPSGGFGSFIQSEHNGVPILWTLSEPFGAQDWWPCKNGLDDKVDSIDVIVTTPAKYRAASNGLLVSEQVLSDSRKSYHWKHRYAIAPYLVAISVTNYSVYTNDVLLSDGTNMPMLNYVYPESESNAKIGTAANVRVLQYFDSLFVAYPFKKEKYGHAQFGWGGGMEHQTMSFVVDYSWGLLAHELAHQWFGDMVTCGSWEDIWLNEGFATYLEGLSRERFPQSNGDWTVWKTGKINSVTSGASGSVKVDNPNSVNRIFNGRLTYNKGGMVVHMLRRKLGDVAFFSGVRNYLNARAFNYAATSQLQQHLEAVSGQNLTEFFEDWYEGQGYPTYDVRWDQKDSAVKFKIFQTTSHASVDFFEMPVDIKLSGEGKEVILSFDHVVSGQTFEQLVDFKVETVRFDPNLWLAAKNEVTRENLFPTGSVDLDATSVTLFPNPAANAITIVKDNALPAHYDIKDVNGKIVKSGILNDFTNSLDIVELPVGTYIFALQDDNKTSISKFIKAQ